MYAIETEKRRPGGEASLFHESVLCIHIQAHLLVVLRVHTSFFNADWKISSFN